MSEGNPTAERMRVTARLIEPHGAAADLRIGAAEIDRLESRLKQCRDIMETNDPLNARALFGAPQAEVSA